MRRPNPGKPSKTSLPRSDSRAPLLCLAVATPALIVGLTTIYLLMGRAAAGEFGFPLDDSWIHVRFAQNLAAGRGFAFNPGEPTSTTTSPLWTLVLAGLYRVTGEYLFTSIACNALLALALCAMAYGLALTLTPSRWLACAAGVVVAATAPLPWWVLSGMEPPLYAALAALGVLLHVRLRRAPVLPGLAPTVAFGLAGLARPECLLLFPLAMLDRLVMARWIEKHPHAIRQWAKELVLHVPLFALISTPPFVHNLLMTGLPLPSSFYSKQQWGSLAGALVMGKMSLVLLSLLVSPWRQLGSVLAAWGRDNLLLVPAFLLGVGWLVRGVVQGRSRHGSLLIPMAVVVQPMAWAVLAGYRPADFQSQRYLAGLNPLFLLVGMAGVWWLSEQVPAFRPRAARVGLVLAVLALSLARQPSAATTYSRNVRDTTLMQVAVARWVRVHVPRRALLAVNDVGAIGALAGNPVLDLQGLVTPEVLPLRSMEQRLAGTAPAALWGYVYGRRPDYVIVFPQWYPEVQTFGEWLRLVHSVEVPDTITSGAPVMVVFQTIWAQEHGMELRP